MAAFIALGAVAGLAQDPCTDADGQTALSDKVRELFPKKDLDSQKAKIDTGKQFLEKYGSCDSAKEFSDYLKTSIPKWEDTYAKAVAADIENKIVARFNTGLNAKNWDDVYASGKDLVANYGDKYRDVELVLGSIGYDESFKNNFKYNDDTLRYAKMSIADLEAGKTFSASYGVPKDFVYKSKDNALGWMNLTIGYIIQVAQKNKKDAQPYLYKATQANSETAKNPIPYELIGNYYFDQLNTLTSDIQAKAADQKETDTPEIAKTKIDAIKAEVALSNGTSERALDAFARAYTLGVAKPYKDKMYKNLQDAYKLRFGKSEGLDPWIVATVKKTMVNPTSPVTPIFDPEPATTTTTNTTPTTIKPPVTTPVKPGTTPVKPGTTPGKPAGTPPPAKTPVTKRQAAIKKRGR